jgi:hypothetical protein
LPYSPEAFVIPVDFRIAGDTGAPINSRVAGLKLGLLDGMGNRPESGPNKPLDCRLRQHGPIPL